MVPSFLPLCEEILGWDGLVLIEAPRGYGKTFLVQCLLNGDAGFVQLSGADLGQIAGEDKVVGSPLIIDGVTETLPPELLDMICVAGRQVVITGRELSQLARWATDRKVMHLGPQDLALSRQDIEVLARSVLGPSKAGVFADSASSLTRGWPALVEALLSDLSESEPTPTGVLGERWDSGRRVQQLVGDCLEHLDGPTLDIFGQLAYLASFSRSCVTAFAGPGGLARAIADGLPVVARSDGWLSVARPVDAALRSRGSFSTLSAELLGPVLIAGGGLVFAAKSLMGAGNASVAADLLRSVPGYRFDDHNQAEIAGMIRSLDSRLGPQPELSLLLARVHHNRAELDQQQSALEEAERRAAALGDTRSSLEAKAELLFLDLGAGADREAMTQRLVELEELVDSDTLPSTRVRLREIRAMYLAQSDELADVYASIALFKDASYEWAGLGEPGRAAWTLRLFAGITCYHLGRYQDALQALDRAAGLVEGRPSSLAKTLELAARFSAMSADRERFEHYAQRTRSMLSGLSLTWIDGFLRWSTMRMAAYDGNRNLVQSALIDTGSLLGELRDHPTGAVFLADSAIALALVGDGPGALKALEQAEERRAEARLEVDLARVEVHARVGNPGLVPGQAASLRESGLLPYERRWRVDLAVLLAESRTESQAGGNQPIDREKLSRVRSKASEYGLEGLFDGLTRSVDPEHQAGAPQLSLKLLGGFSVSGAPEGGLSPGHSTQLVKYLAAAGGEVPVEVVIEVLWPDTEPRTGRKRFRNVINRTRSALGPDSVVRTGDLVRLSPDVQTDLCKFRSLSGEALTGTSAPAARTGLAIKALNLYLGDLLPDDLYSEWVESHRQTARMTAVGLLDLVIASPSPEVVPSWLMETASRVGAKTEDLWLDVARFAERHDARECCREAVHRAEAAARELGYEPSAATQELLKKYQ